MDQKDSPSQPVSSNPLDTQARQDIVRAINGLANIWGTFPLPITMGGTGASTAAGARSNLGLGTMAVQDATAVAVTGGTINSATIGGSTPAAGTFTALASTGNTTLGDASGDSIVMNAKSITEPNCPCFLARKTTAQNNATGNGTVVTVGFETEVFDQGSDFASNTFTAPVTGKYLLETMVRISDYTTAMTETIVSIVTTARTYQKIFQFTPDASSALSWNMGVIADMSATNTATVTVKVSNGAGDTADIPADATLVFSYFSGKLIA